MVKVNKYREDVCRTASLPLPWDRLAGKTIGELLSLIDVSWLDISVADKRNSLPDEIFPGIEDCANQEGLKVGG